MLSTTTLWLLRHGEIEQPPVKSFIGQWDLALSLAGQAQIRTWKDFFATKDIAIILSSDLMRCKQSVEELCLPHIPVIYDTSFREINLGTWEGQSITQVKANEAEAYAIRGSNLDTFRPPQGESFNDLAKRVQKDLYKYLTKYEGKNIILMAHAGVNRVIIANYLSMPFKDVLDIPQPYACCTKIEL